MNATDITPTRDRSLFLGGSDAAAVMGLSPWATPVELWQQKTGRVEKNADVDPAAAKRHARGHKLEPFIRDMVIDKMTEQGLVVELLQSNHRYVDDEHPWMSCEIDFELSVTGDVLIGENYHRMDGEVVNADAKSVSGFARKKWGQEDTEDVPIEYAAQFMHGLMVTGRRYCLVAALRSFDDVDIYWTVRDDETIAAMRAREIEFWINHVEMDVPPDPLNFSDIKALFPVDNGEAVEADALVEAAVKRLREIKAQIKDLENSEEELTFQIADFISPAARLVRDGKELATWKAQEARRLDQKRLKDEHASLVEQYMTTSTTRVLRLKAPK